MTDYVHPGWVRSSTDGDRHWIGGARLIELYGLNPATTVVVDREERMQGYRPQPWDRHFFPRFDGDYQKERR